MLVGPEGKARGPTTPGVWGLAPSITKLTALQGLRVQGPSGPVDPWGHEGPSNY